MQNKTWKKQPKKIKRKYPFSGFWLICCLICILYAAIRINIVDIPLERDEGIFGYIGQVILDHGMPYKDALEHKPPIVFYIYALALLVFPPTAAGIHLFLHLYNFLTLIALFFLAKTFYESKTTGLWVAFVYAVFSSSPAIQGFTASTEMFMLLPITLSLLFAVLTVHHGKILFSLMSGICAALACWTKPTGALIMVFIISYLIVALLRIASEQKTNHTKIGKVFLLWGGGFVGISLLIVGYFYCCDAFDEFTYWTFTHNIYYSKMYKELGSMSRFYQEIKNVAVGNIFTVVIGLCVGLIYLLKKKSEGFFVLGFLLFSLLATLPGNAYRHYFAQVATAAAIAGGFGISFFTGRIINKKMKATAIMLCAGLVMAVPFTVYSDYYFCKSPNQFVCDFFGYNPFPESIDIARFISKRTGCDDHIFILGSEPQILLYAQRKSATPFVTMYPLTRTVYPQHKKFQRNTWQKINASKPVYIISVKLKMSHLWDGKADLWLYKKVDHLIRQKYYLEAVMTIAEPKGKLLLGSQIDPSRNYPIYIYRRR